MVGEDRRRNRTYSAVKSAVCEILLSEPLYKLTSQCISRKAGINISTFHRLAPTIWKLLEMFDMDIRQEFTARRRIQQEYGLDSISKDFFMQLQPQFAIIVSISTRCCAVGITST